MKKILLTALLFTGLLFMFNSNVYASNVTYQVDVGSFDIWKNTAGEWIKAPPYGAYKPGDYVEVLPFRLKGPQGATGVKSVKYAPAVVDWQKDAHRVNEYERYVEYFSHDVSNIKFKYIPATNEVELQYKTKLETNPRIDRYTGKTLTTGKDVTTEYQNATVEGYRYYNPLLIEWETEQWWIDVVTTEPDEIAEDWEIDSHLGTGKVVTGQGMANLADKAHNLTYYQNGDKVNINFTFWNPMGDISIAPPLKYAVMYWKHPDSLFDMPGNYEKNYIHSEYTTIDIFPRDNAGKLSYEYTVDIDKYPFELTTGKQINEISQDYPSELKAKVNPCKEDDLFLTLAVVVDPDAVLSPQSETLEPGQETWISLTSNIMVVHVPVVKKQGVDIAITGNVPMPIMTIPSNGIKAKSCVNYFISRKDGGTDPVEVKLSIYGSVGTKTETFILDSPRVTKTYWIETNQPGKYISNAEVWPTGEEDLYPPDNKTPNYTMEFVKPTSPERKDSDSRIEGQL